jgi:hypothetical protein
MNTANQNLLADIIAGAIILCCSLSMPAFAGKKEIVQSSSCTTVCCQALEALVNSGKMPIEFARAVQGVVDEGPERWIEVKGNGITGLVFQRGVSGAIGVSRRHNAKHMTSGAQDALTILLGEGNSADAHVSVMSQLEDSHQYLDEVNRSFAFPLVVRGEAKPFDLSITEPDPSDPATIPAQGVVPQNIHSMGFFFQNLASDDGNYLWASNYISLMEGLEQKGISPSANSRGARFLIEIKELWNKRREYSPDRMDNELRDLFSKYRK